MSQICLQFGQCGNQLGYKFFETIYQNKTGKEIWFRPTIKGDTAHCILVDTESKVVPSLIEAEKQWSYEKENSIVGSGGSGNNWALGYSVNGPLLFDKIFQRIRLECEKSDNVQSILTFLSGGGGTGSGVGTYVIERLRDLFPKKYIITCFVIPFSSGSNTIHLYNTILSLSKLNDSCDAVITFYNEFLFKQCLQVYRDNDFKFNEINNIISKQMYTALRSYNGISFFQTLPKLVPLPNLKLLSIKSCPITKDNSNCYETLVPWISLIERLKSMLVTNCDSFWDYSNRVISKTKQDSSNYYNAIGNVLICNGKGASSANIAATACFKTDALYSKYSSSTDRFTYIYDNRPLYGQLQFSSLLSNSALFINRLDSVVDKAWNSFIKNAYCHHFEKYGLNQRELSIAFLKVENIIKEYRSL